MSEHDSSEPPAEQPAEQPSRRKRKRKSGGLFAGRGEASADAKMRSPADLAAGQSGSSGGDAGKRKRGGSKRRRRLLIGAAVFCVLAGSAVAFGLYLRGQRTGSVWALHDQAAASFAAGDFEAAAAMNERILASRPEDRTARFNLGAALLALKRFDEAWPHIERVAKEDPGHDAAQLALARRAMEDGQEDVAITRLRKVIEQPPEPYIAHSLLERLLRRRGEMSAAMRSLAALTTDDEAPLALRVASAVRLAGLHGMRAPFHREEAAERQAELSAYARARDLANVLLERGGADATAAHGHVARIELALGRPQLALAACDLAVEAADDPVDRAGLRTLRAQIYAVMGSDDAAREELDAALSESESPSAAAFAGAADFHLARRENAAALVLLEKGAAAFPKDEELGLTYARVLFLSGRPDDADQEARRLVAALPGSTRALLALAGFQRLRGDFAGARASYQTALERTPGDALVTMRLADAMFAEAGENPEVEPERLAEADALARRVLEKEPNNVDALVLAAKVILARGSDRDGESGESAGRRPFERAAKMLRQAVDLDPFVLEAHAFLAWADLERGRAGEAVLGLERVLASLPEDRPHLRLLLAQAHLRAGNFDQAAIEARRGLEIEPQDVRGLRTLVDALRASDLLEEALDALGRLHVIEPQNVVFVLLQAQLHAQRGNVAAAEERFARAEEIASEIEDETQSMDAQLQVAQGRAAFYQALGDTDAAKGAYTQLIGRTRGSAESHVRYGQFLLALGQEVEAEREFQQAIGRDPAAIAPRRALAELYFGRRKATPELVALVETVARAHPSDPAVDYLRGKLAFLQGDLRVAADLLERYLQVRSDDADGHFAAGVVLTRAGRFQDAVTHMERAAELAPKSADVHVALARTRYAWGEALMRRGRYREAQTALQQAAAGDPTAAEPQQMLAKSLALSGNVDLSEQQVRLLLRRNPDDPIARRMLAGVYLLRQDFDRAAEELEKVVKTQPDDWSTWTMLATVHLKRAAPEAALKAARKARAAAPDEPLSMAAVIQVLMDTGELARARSELRALIEVDPRAAYYRYMVALIDVREGAFEAAVTRLTEALDREPGMAVALRLAVSVLIKNLRDEPRALALAAAWAPKAPESLGMQHLHAALTWRAGDVEAAITRLRVLVELEPPFLPSVVLLASLHVDQGRAAEGRDVLTHALTHFPEVADLHYLLGENYLRQAVEREPDAEGGVPEPERGLAVQSFQRADELRPRHPPTLNTLAYLLSFSTDTRQKALDLVEQALTIAPEYVPYIDTQASILLALDKPQAAVDVLRRALGVLKREEAALEEAERNRSEEPLILAARRRRYERDDRDVRAKYEKALEAANK